MARPLLRRRCRLGCALLMFFVLPGMAEAQDTPIGEAPEERDADDIFLRGQRVLLARGDVVLDFGQFFSRSDALQLAVVDNNVQLATLEQSVLTTLFVGRLGLMNETEVYAGASFHRLEDRLVAGATNVALGGHSVLGNVVLGVRRTLLREGVGRSDIVATFDSQIPTDEDRQYVAGGGLVFVKSVDPVVLFAASSYQHAFRRTLPDGTGLGSPWA